MHLTVLGYPTCSSIGEQITTPGIFTSPGYDDPGYYPRHTDCSWRIEAPMGNVSMYMYNRRMQSLSWVD